MPESEAPPLLPHKVSDKWQVFATPCSCAPNVVVAGGMILNVARSPVSLRLELSGFAGRSRHGPPGAALGDRGDELAQVNTEFAPVKQ
jgi:hypothetical protein